MKTEIGKSFSIGARSIETSLILDELRKMKDNQTVQVSYQALNAAVGFDVRQRRSNLSSARHIMRQEHGVDFQTIRGIGLKIATNQEVIGSAQRDRRNIGKRSRRSVMNLYKCCDYTGLPNEDKPRYNTEFAVLSTLAHMTQEKVARALTIRTEETQKRLTVDETLSALRRKQED
jgi:hypothetical protein